MPPSVNTAQCFNKWIISTKYLVDGTWQKTRNVTKISSLWGGQPPKVTQKSRKKIRETDAKEIRDLLRRCTEREQYERDVAMWYGYCRNGSKGAKLALKLFSIFKFAGVMYRDSTGTWQDFTQTFPHVPVASLLSHGGRILIQLPAANSWFHRLNLGNKAFTLVKSVSYDPLKSLFGNQQQKTILPQKKRWAPINLLARGAGVGVSVLSAGHKTYEAGDDRFWWWLTGGRFSQGAAHTRALATHSTIRCRHPKPLPQSRLLYFDEEKAPVTSNIRDSMLGRHHYKNLALGGIGNLNPFSGMKITKDGSHGHLYINYRAPGRSTGCLLLGVEGSAPGKGNQYGKVHDASATKGEFSATGGQKWDLLKPGTFYKPSSKKDATIFVCDLSDIPTERLISLIRANEISADKLHYPIVPLLLEGSLAG